MSFATSWQPLRGITPDALRADPQEPSAENLRGSGPRLGRSILAASWDSFPVLPAQIVLCLDGIP